MTGRERRDWDTGFPSICKIREKDEKYWAEYRGTPKAFVTLAAGQEMWSNRFGNLTAVRYPSANNSVPDLTEALRRQLDPATVGLAFQPVRAQALAASEQAFDFGQLFLGFSFDRRCSPVDGADPLGIEQRLPKWERCLPGLPAKTGAAVIPRRRRRDALIEVSLVSQARLRPNHAARPFHDLVRRGLSAL
jgi:hypothetical protein